MDRSDSLEVAALGRTFALGTLYDARDDTLLPGLTLHGQITNTPKPYSNFEVSVSDSIESKSSLMDIELSLKASFLCGLVEVGGSAKYLNDTKKFKNQSRVTCLYKATTHFNELSMNQLETMINQEKDSIKRTMATHVVSKILYGADAFFVFDSEKLEDSSVQDIQGHMEAVMKKIPTFNVEGKVDIQLTDEEKEVTNKFSCKFYGDFILESNPATFEDAVKTYVELPKLLRENGTVTVPLKVWMMPLKVFDTTAAELKREISAGLVWKAQDALEDLKEMEMRCNDSLDNTLIENFPQIQKELKGFKIRCDLYASELRKNMRDTFPLIRDGEEEESSVEKLLDDRNKSPFSHEKLDKWLDHKEREINVIRSCVEMMEGTKIVHNQSELDREVLAAGVDDALCFVFTSLQSADPVLDEMDKYLVTFVPVCIHEDPWYYSDDVLDKMREKAESVHNLAKALKNSRRFRSLVAAIDNKKYTGATIYHYKNGKLLTEDFSKPALPPVRNITDRINLIWYACDLTLDPNTANGYLHLSEDNKKATCDSWLYYPDHPERFDSLTQVLCKEGLTGRNYWEVEFSRVGVQVLQVSVSILAAYKGVARKGKGYDAMLGRNSISWAFGNVGCMPFSTFVAWHIDQVWAASIPPEAVNKVGVFLDHEGGTLSFYRVSSNNLEHLYTFDSRFTEPVYPGLSAYHYYNYARICPFD
ncbi:neoverrucotoxin subunit alpha-like [Sparus aurata]|uniref:neoverrucotoxin subunit alpha-like n=1 Tax=Sparus aurata TaxID=8175 RepID=UPI0011C15C68|nr:neoverrucotoxin subunit alpha-like [Sparus aurata]